MLYAPLCVISCFVLEAEVDPLPYMPLLDGVRIMEAIR